MVNLFLDWLYLAILNIRSILQVGPIRSCRWPVQHFCRQPPPPHMEPGTNIITIFSSNWRTCKLWQEMDCRVLFVPEHYTTSTLFVISYDLFNLTLLPICLLNLSTNCEIENKRYFGRGSAKFKKELQQEIGQYLGH